MPQGEAMWLELVLQRWAIGTAFDQGGARYLIHLDDLAEIAQVKRDGRLIANPVDPRLDTAADARAAPERRQRGADPAGPVHHSRYLGFVIRIGDHVGRAVVVAEHGAHVVRIGFTVGVGCAVVAFAGAAGGKRGRRHNARGAQGEILKARHRYGLEPVACKFRAVTAEHKSLLRGRHALAFAAPAVMFQPCTAHGFLPGFFLSVISEIAGLTPNTFWLARAAQ